MRSLASRRHERPAAIERYDLAFRAQDRQRPADRVPRDVVCLVERGLTRELRARRQLAFVDLFAQDGRQLLRQRLRPPKIHHKSDDDTCSTWSSCTTCAALDRWYRSQLRWHLWRTRSVVSEHPGRGQPGTSRPHDCSSPPTEQTAPRMTRAAQSTAGASPTTSRRDRPRRPQTPGRRNRLPSRRGEETHPKTPRSPRPGRRSIRPGVA